MIDQHLDDSILDAFTGGMSSRQEDERVSSHIKVCAHCAERLMQFAKAEEAIEGIARSRPAGGRANSTRPSLSRRSHRLTLGAALIASAATLAVFVTSTLKEQRVESQSADAIPAVICPDGPDQHECVAATHRQGLIVDYPSSAGPPLLGAAPLLVREWELE